jgi:hypothetical protein
MSTGKGLGTKGSTPASGGCPLVRRGVPHSNTAHSHRDRHQHTLLASTLEGLLQRQHDLGQVIALRGWGTTAEILGLGVETGALARDVDGSKLTFRPRPLGIVRPLQGLGLLDLYRDYESRPTPAFASRWSPGVTFDTAPGSAPGSLTARGGTAGTKRHMLASWC